MNNNTSSNNVLYSNSNVPDYSSSSSVINYNNSIYYHSLPTPNNAVNILQSNKNTVPDQYSHKSHIDSSHSQINDALENLCNLTNEFDGFFGSLESNLIAPDSFQKEKFKTALEYLNVIQSKYSNWTRILQSNNIHVDVGQSKHLISNYQQATREYSSYPPINLGFQQQQSSSSAYMKSGSVSTNPSSVSVISSNKPYQNPLIELPMLPVQTSQLNNQKNNGVGNLNAATSNISVPLPMAAPSASLSNNNVNGGGYKYDDNSSNNSNMNINRAFTFSEGTDSFPSSSSSAYYSTAYQYQPSLHILNENPSMDYMSENMVLTSNGLINNSPGKIQKPKPKTKPKPKSKSKIESELNDSNTHNNEEEENDECQHCRSTGTPEWRRGPNGERSLCNACGLFYSKLVKKYGTETAKNIMHERKSSGRASDRKVSIT